MRRRNEQGQSLVETVLVMPVLLFLLLNTLNFGYFFLTFVNLTASTRTGVEYAIMGSSAIPSKSLPPAGDTWPPTKINTVAYVIYYDMVGAMFSPGTLAAVRVCSPSILVNNSGYTANGMSNCAQYGTLPSGYSWPPRVTTNCKPPTGNDCGKDPNLSFTMDEVDAVYHLLFDELRTATAAAGTAEQKAALHELVTQGRLRPFADLAPSLVAAGVDRNGTAQRSLAWDRFTRRCVDHEEHGHDDRPQPRPGEQDRGDALDPT